MYPSTQSLPLPAPSPNSAVRAGWICFAIFACAFWIPILGGLCFAAAIALAIVALATNQVRAGLILLLTTAGFGILLGLTVLVFGVGMLGLAAKSAQQAVERQQKEMAHAQRRGQTALPTPPSFAALAPRPAVPPPIPVTTPVRTIATATTTTTAAALATPAPGGSTADPTTELFVRQARLTSIMGGEPPIVVINGRGYELGQEIVTPDGARLRVNAVTTETVTLRGRTRDYQLRLK